MVKGGAGDEVRDPGRGFVKMLKDSARFAVIGFLVLLVGCTHDVSGQAALRKMLRHLYRLTLARKSLRLICRGCRSRLMYDAHGFSLHLMRDELKTRSWEGGSFVGLRRRSGKATKIMPSHRPITGSFGHTSSTRMVFLCSSSGCTIIL
jgi:hypothetical protein